MNQDSKPKAIIMMLISSFSFALMQLLAKMSGDLPVAQKLFFRNLLGVILLGAIIWYKGAKPLGKKHHRKWLITRSIFGTLGVATNLYAVSHMNLADSTMLNRFSPFFVMILAVIFLKESIRKEHLYSLAAAFVGILLIIKPSFTVDALPALVGFSSALFAGSAYVVLRFLKDKEEPLTIVFFFSLFSCIVSLPLTLIQYQAPTAEQWLALTGFGLFALGGQYFITTAYKYAPAGEISIYGYVTVIFSALLGNLVLAEMPDIWSWIGISIVLLSAFFLYRVNLSKVPSVTQTKKKLS
jgi:drug/metabolite transporter (DMT)-like permease